MPGGRQSALDWLRKHEVPAYSPDFRAFNDPIVLPLDGAIQQDTLYAQKYILFHKGHLSKIEPSWWASFAGRSEIVFANDVYVILCVRSIDKESDAVKSFFQYAIDQTPDGLSGSKRTGRFCQYIGNQTVLTETSFKRKIYLDSEDISLTPHIMYDGSWEPWVTDVIMRELGPGDTFVDIGANCGYFSLLAAHLVGPTGFVVAIEPQKALADRIKKSIAVNGFGAFASVAQLATGEKQIQASLGRFGAYKGSASLLPGGSTLGDSEQVDVKPLPVILANIQREFGRSIKPTFMKMDVEGYEYSAWLGMRDLLEEPSPMRIVLEFSPRRYVEFGQDPKAFVADMLHLGFSITWLQHDGLEESFGVDSVDAVLKSDDFADLILRR